MLILAGVSINAIVGEDGLLSKAQYAKLASEDAAWFENAEMLLVEAYGDVDKIPDMQAWLLDRFNGISNGDTVCVTPYKDGYLIVSGKRMITVDKDMQITSSRENTYLIATGDDWYFEPNGTGTCKLTAYKLSLTGTMTIPSVVTDKDTGNVYMVTELADDIFNYATNVTKIDFSASYNLTKIGARAFAFCSNLEINVPDDLPSTITNIGDKAFYSCNKLNGNINTIMNHGYILGKGVFMKCPNLTGEIQAVFDQNFYLDESGNPVATVVEESQFSGYSGLTGSLTIPSYITEIKANAFYGCSGISALNFEENSACTSIGNYAFSGTSNMKSNLALPNTITSLGEYTFAESGITGLVLPNKLQSMGQYCFYTTSLNGTIIIPKTLEEIPDCAFRGARSINNIIFEYDIANDKKEGCKMIGTLAFYLCSSLQNITFPETLIYVGTRAFDEAYKLENIYLPNSIEKIYDGAFWRQKKMKITNWPTSLKTIGSKAFAGCSVLETLPDTTSLISIGSQAFSGCTNLGKTNGDNKTDVIAWIQSSKITTIGDNCFENCKYLTGNFTGSIMNVSNTVVTLGASCFANTSVDRSTILNLASINTISDNAYTGTTKFIDSYNNEITEILIPSNITSIGKNAFAGCTSIIKITIPNTVTAIGESAFSNCTNLQIIEFENGINLNNIPSRMCYDCSKLENIVLPDTITSIGSKAFENCANLTNIDIPNFVTTIGSATFYGCSSLKVVNLNEGLKTIGDSGLANTGITEIVFPSTLNSLGYLPDCKSLTKVTFKGDVKEICGWTFKGCTNLYEVNFLNQSSNLKIGNNSFLSCTKLSVIKGLDWSKVTYIGDNAFYNCTSLSGTVKVNPQCYIHENALIGCPLIITK